MNPRKQQTKEAAGITSPLQDEQREHTFPMSLLNG